MRFLALVFLWAMLLMSAGFGFLYLFAPTTMTDAMGYGLLSAPARTDIRAVFGGFQLAAGVFLLWCLKPGRTRIGLIFMFFAGLGFVACRGYGIYVDGVLSANLRTSLLLESTITVIALALFLLVSESPSGQRPDGAPRFARLLLIVAAIALGLSGVLSAVLPSVTMSPMGFGPLPPEALTDARASYGGFQLGLAAFLVWCWRTARLYAGALSLAFHTGLVAGCRVLGLVIDGAWTGAHLGATAFEAGLAIAASVVALRILRDTRNRSRA